MRGDHHAPFTVALAGIVLIVALVGTFAVMGPFTATPPAGSGNIVGHPFATGDDYDVTLVSPDPVYAYTDAHFPPPAGYIPWRVFETITYLPGTGQFIVGGICNIGTGTYAQYAHKYGMYAITDAGELAGTRDICLDTSTARAGDWCGAETHRCTNIGTRITALPDGQFIREMAISGSARPSAVYSASGGGMEMYARQPLVDPETVPADALVGMSNIAVANGRAIGVSHTPDHNPKNTIYSLPDLQLVASFDREYSPIVGVGEYFIAFSNNGGSGTSGWEYSVYHMPASGTATPVKVSTFANKLVVGSGIVDSLDPNRIGILLKDKTTDVIEFVIYDAGPNGLVEESRRVAPQRWMGTMTYPGAAMAGEYLVYGRCPSTSQLFEERAESCRVFVEKAGVDLAVEQLPRDNNGRRRTVTAAAISDTGRILLSTSGYTSIDPSAIARVYLYDIREFGSNPPPPGGGGDGDLPPPPNPQLPDCFSDSDCEAGHCVAGVCEASCVTDADCDALQACASGRCEAAQLSNAQFSSSTVSCDADFPKIFCVADISWTSDGEGAIQLVQQDGKRRACAPAGEPKTKSLIATTQARTYELKAAASCDSEPYRTLDTITVQASRD